ncbi:MAG: hypothetical protein LBV78_06815 [Kitasatospora sp.]|jgi:hypothetical protein|nr:hypothetical protein [Kitasatospora sp.]
MVRLTEPKHAEAAGPKGSSRQATYASSHGVRHDTTGRLAQYEPREELTDAQLTCAHPTARHMAHCAEVLTSEIPDSVTH